MRHWLGMLLLSLACGAGAGELQLLVQDRTAPYMYRDQQGHYRGMAIEILDAAARRMGSSMHYRESSQVRLLLSAKALPGIDAVAPVQGEDHDGLYFSEPFFGFDDVVVTHAGSGLAVTGLADLDHLEFSIWQQGWHHLGPEFEAKYRPDANGQFRKNYHEYANHETIVKVFWARRVEAAVVDRYVFNWYTRQLASGMAVNTPVTIHAIFAQPTPYKAAFRDRGMRDRFNQALKAIQADGTVRDIQRRY